MDRWHDQDTRLSAYKLAQIEDRTAHDLVVRACDVGVCPNKLIPRVLHEWRQPLHEPFLERNVWSLFNAFTEALKGNLIELPRRTEALHGLLDNHVGLQGRRAPRCEIGQYHQKRITRGSLVFVSGRKEPVHQR